eukprot:4223617-Pyramimonas_sp.AAC.3
MGTVAHIYGGGGGGSSTNQPRGQSARASSSMSSRSPFNSPPAAAKPQRPVSAYQRSAPDTW